MSSSRLSDVNPEYISTMISSLEKGNTLENFNEKFELILNKFEIFEEAKEKGNTLENFNEKFELILNKFETFEAKENEILAQICLIRRTQTNNVCLEYFSAVILGSIISVYITFLYGCYKH